jgi:hypothetical protein
LTWNNQWFGVVALGAFNGKLAFESFQSQQPVLATLSQLVKGIDIQRWSQSRWQTSVPVLHGPE